MVNVIEQVEDVPAFFESQWGHCVLFWRYRRILADVSGNFRFKNKIEFVNG